MNGRFAPTFRYTLSQEVAACCPIAINVGRRVEFPVSTLNHHWRPSASERLIHGRHVGSKSSRNVHSTDVVHDIRL